MLKEHEHTVFGQFERTTLVEGITQYELDQRLERWVRFHNPTLMARSGSPPTSLAGARTSSIRQFPFARAGRARRRRGQVLPRRERGDYHRRGWAWAWAPVAGEHLAAAADGQGTVACPPLAVQTVPFGLDGARAEEGGCLEGQTPACLRSFHGVSQPSVSMSSIWTHQRWWKLL